MHVGSFASGARKVPSMHHSRGAIMQCFVPRPHPQYVASTNCLNLKFTVSEPWVTVAMASLLVHLMMPAIEMQNSFKKACLHCFKTVELHQAAVFGLTTASAAAVPSPIVEAKSWSWWRGTAGSGVVEHRGPKRPGLPTLLKHTAHFPQEILDGVSLYFAHSSVPIAYDAVWDPVVKPFPKR